ncbi:choice-of-anchor M domain-containing protein [Glycomyces buryatensis]|uniref:Surface-anchored protein n=1 Tax=Glycomyces buryatensis TaxID=2570927 RepID=A0A4S8QEL2_9ACTN|nr:choice-of-anchor M domain-containing protein [Glycomyces buryatensis]THV42780.1 hypothetical protein FAB82_04470 [Glycomyces buryatensis]
MTTTRLRRHGLALAAAALLATLAAPAPAAQAATHDGRTVLSIGHTDAMQTYYENGELGLRVKDDTGDSPVYRDPDDVLFQVLPEAETPIPPGDDWSFLGDVGDPVWMLPLTQDADLLWPGWSTEPLSKGQFKNDQVSMSLTSVSGPGEVILWSVGTFGAPNVTFNSRDGLADAINVNVPAHVHSYWGFTATGSYTLTWEVSGTLADGTEVSTGNVDYRWQVGELPSGSDPDPTDPTDPAAPDLTDRLVLDEGHVDVFSAHLDGQDLTLQTKDDTRLHSGTTAYRDPDDIAFHAVPESKITLGSDMPYDWQHLGEAGDEVWWLPDTDMQGILFAGWSTETIGKGVLADEALDLTMTGLSGPGDLVMMQVDGFGAANVQVDTEQSLPQTITTGTKTHAHTNWYFTEPGVYSLTWQAEATLVDGTEVASDPETYVFVVDEWPADDGDDGDDGDDDGDGDGDDGDPGSPALENTQVITATIDADNGGLILSVDPNDRNVDLGAATLNNTATRWTSTGGLRPVTVTDTRTADPGWNASGQVGNFSSGDYAFDGGHLSWTPGISSTGDSQEVSPGPSVDGLLDGGQGLSVSQLLASASAGNGNGTAVLDADLRLDLPTDVESGTYTALVTFTAI